METISLEVKKNYLDGNGDPLTIQVIHVELTPDGELHTVITAFSAGEMSWYRLPGDRDEGKLWRPV